MRLITILLFTITCCMFAENTHSQNVKVDLDMQNATLTDVFREIEKQSEYRFFYNNAVLNITKKLNLKAKDKELKDVLEQLFSQTDMTYRLVDKYIVITPKSDSSPSGLPQVPNTKTITGIVTDTNGDPVIGANVVEKGTTNGVITDMDGKFSLTVSENAVLQVSYIGYVAQEIKIGNKGSFNITLKEDTQALDEVVVIGYGTMKKSDLTGSVASIQGDRISEKASSVKISETLQGLTPGLMVTRGGASDSNVSSTIRIRGVTTIGDSDPLIIIDGIPAESIDRVNPNDIESISVLKDAASASIYGSRAAAGVILVTTKRAKEGQLSISYDYSFSFERPTRTASYENAVGHMRLENERSWNDNPDGGEYQTYAKDLIDNYASLNAQDPDRYPDTDWHDLMLKNWAYKNKHMISLQAGTKYVKSYFSLNVDDTEGLYMGKKYDRYTVRSNNDITINKYFSANINFNGLYSINSEPQSSSAGLAVIPGQILQPIYAAEWSDGRTSPGKSGENPYAILKHAGSKDTKSSLFGGKFQLNFTPIENLTFSAAYATEFYNVKIKNFLKKVNYTNLDDPLTVGGTVWGAETTDLRETRNDRRSETLQFFANYKNSFGKHHLSLMAGYEENSDFYENLGASRLQYELSNFPYLNLGNANYQFNSGNAYEYANRSFLGRVIYDFKNKYLLQSNVRYDGSSRFHKDHRWGLFPSISAGWVISEESFMEDVKDLSFLKFRASWGSLGNERIGYYPYQSTMSFNSLVLFQGNNAVAAQGAAVMNYAIPDISWETTESYNLGVDIGLLNNRLTVTADIYKKITKDMLLALEIPSYIGLSNPDQNTGRMNTKGWEFSVGWNDRIGDFRYSITGHLSDSKSVMGDLGGTEFLGSQVKFKGSEFNEWYGYVSDGLYQTQEEVDNSAVLYSNLKPGDVKYKDISGPDGIPDGKISAEYDRVLLGGSLPRFLYGGNINMEYKNFSFGLIFQGVGKQNSYMNISWVRPYYEYPTIIDGNSWSLYNTNEQNLKVKYPRITMTNRSNNYAVSDYWLFNGAYFRLKNISLAYTIPQSLTSKVKLNSARVFVNASDLFSIDKYPDGWDPETTTSYWVNRSFTLGFSVKF